MYVSELQLLSYKFLLGDRKGSKDSPGDTSHSVKAQEGVS